MYGLGFDVLLTNMVTK